MGGRDSRGAAGRGLALPKGKATAGREGGGDVSYLIPNPRLRFEAVTTATASRHPPYRLYLLGGASVIGPAGPVTAIAGDPPLIALVALLAAARPGEATRRALGAALWPDLAAEQADHELDTTLARLGALLDPACLITSGGGLAFDPVHLWCDVAAYRDHLDAGEHLEAAANYQGPFLDRFHLDGAGGFNQWMHAERDRHAHAFRDLAAALATEAIRGRDGQAAARWWTRLVDADPWNPAAALQAMEGFEAMGERPAAMAVAEEFLGRTHERLGREPDPVIAGHLERLRGAPPRSARRGPLVLAIVVLLVSVLVLMFG